MRSTPLPDAAASIGSITARPGASDSPASFIVASGSIVAPSKPRSERVTRNVTCRGTAETMVAAPGNTSPGIPAFRRSAVISTRSLWASETADAAVPSRAPSSISAVCSLVTLAPAARVTASASH
jgi:hypothetical protein